jgi:hypothetical protein
MSQQCYFGVELEFTLAIFWQENAVVPPEAVGKTVQFQVSPGARMGPVPPSTADTSKLLEYWEGPLTKPVQDHLQKAFADNDLHAQTGGVLDDNDEPVEEEVRKVELWHIGRDDSVKYPDRAPGVPYIYFPAEIASPKFPFNEKSLQDIIKACKVLNDNYVVEANDSCGLHVHVSTEWDFKTLKNLVRFLWAFEPQMDSLHNSRRQEGEYAQSWRTSSGLVHQFYEKHGTMPNPELGLRIINKASSMSELLDLMIYPSGSDKGKYRAFNVKPLQAWLKDEQTSMPTIEFRQHAGSLNGEEIVNWVSLIVGIVQYCQKVEDVEFERLLEVTEAEAWEKQGDHSDVLNEQKHGRILAEGRFTIIHLLNRIGLKDSAAYYERRGIHQVSGKTKRYRISPHEER